MSEPQAEKEALGALLREHRIMSRNRNGKTGCRACRWQGSVRPGTDEAWGEWAQHVLDLPTSPVTEGGGSDA